VSANYIKGYLFMKYPLLKKRGVVASSSIRKFKQGLCGFSTYLVALNP